MKCYGGSSTRPFSCRDTLFHPYQAGLLHSIPSPYLSIILSPLIAPNDCETRRQRSTVGILHLVCRDIYSCRYVDSYFRVSYNNYCPFRDRSPGHATNILLPLPYPPDS
jgi:hypothetical protein